MFLAVCTALLVGALAGFFLVPRSSKQQAVHLNGHAKSAPTLPAQDSALAPEQLLQLIKARRSVYPKDLDPSAAPISRQQVEQLMEAANWAPTHGKTEPWRYTILRGQEQVQAMLDLTVQCNREAQSPEAFQQWQPKFRKKQASFASVQWWIFIKMKRQANPSKVMPEWEEMCATASSMQNVQLMAHALGLGGYWASWTEAARQHPRFKQWLGLEPEDVCLGVFLLGRPGPGVAAYRASRGPMEAKVDWL